MNNHEQSCTPPLLSLCIPTYNRASLLKMALEAIIGQIGVAQTDQVEIIVSDNASPDGTAEVVKDLQAAHPNVFLHFYRQPENKGPDANIYQVVRLAQGEFVYILSDDDVLLPGAVHKLLSLMETYPTYDAFALNVRVFNDDPWAFAPAEILLSEDQFVHDKSKALLIFNTWIRYISAMAFRRSLISNNDYSDKIGTYFVQAYMFLDVLDKGHGIIFTSQPFIAQRDDNMTVLDFCRVYVTNFAALMNHARSLGCTGLAIQPIHQRNINILRGVVFSNTLSGRWNKFLPNAWDAAGRLLRVYPAEPVVLFQILPVLLLPRWLVPPSHRIYKILRDGINTVRTTKRR